MTPKSDAVRVSGGGSRRSWRRCHVIANDDDALGALDCRSVIDIPSFAGDIAIDIYINLTDRLIELY